MGDTGADWGLDAEVERGVTRLQLRGRPRTLAAWTRSCDELQDAWPLSGRVELEVLGPDEPIAGLSGGEPEALVSAAASLLRARRRSRAPLIVRVDGRVAGPWLALTLSAELLVVSEGMAAEALFWEDSQLLTPGEMLGVADRLGRAQALEWALAGRSFSAADLLERHAAMSGEAGRRAWDSARAGSLVAQEAAASLLRSRETGRAALETLERTAFAACFWQGDRAEGVKAFRELRDPQFQSQRD